MRFSCATLLATGAALMLALPAGAAQTELISVCTGDGVRMVALAPEHPDDESRHNCQKACHALCDRKKAMRNGARR